MTAKSPKGQAIGESPVTIWTSCYDESWKGLIVDEAFAHPAKFAYGLIRRIVQHGLERGYWARGDVIGDPFGGIGSGGIVCHANGLRWRAVELESRFCDLARQNFAKWHLDPADVSIIQGDSRRFAELVACAGVVTSPPFGPEEKGAGLAKPDARYLDGTRIGTNCGYQNQATTEGNLASLPPGSLDAVLTSPPYAETATTAGNVGNATRETWGQGKRLCSASEGYGSAPGQLGALREGTVDSVVTSPPWEGFIASQQGPDTPANRRLVESGTCGGTGFLAAKYGQSDGQLGNTAGDTYWQAVAEIYCQCRLAMKPGGYIAVVVKDYVKNKARVPLCDNTWTLLQHVGFEPVERVRAMLVKEATHDGLFEPVTTRKERKSFFRRLAERKGSPRIDWEEVLFLRKPRLA